MLELKILRWFCPNEKKHDCDDYGGVVDGLSDVNGETGVEDEYELNFDWKNVDGAPPGVDVNAGFEDECGESAFNTLCTAPKFGHFWTLILKFQFFWRKLF